MTSRMPRAALKNPWAGEGSGSRLGRYELLLWMNLLTIIFIILQPQHFEILLGIMIVNTSPFIGHFLALTHTRLTNLTFYALIFLILFITAYNLWIP